MKCAVITPVGPGHEAHVAGVSGASLGVAKAYGMGPFTEIDHYVMDDTKGEHGRSNRRNDALKQALGAGVDWVFFLDADDRITPNAFEVFGKVIAAEPELDAVWGLICTTRDDRDMDLREEQPASLDSRDDLLAYPPYLSLNIGHFVRTACAAAVGFDPEMNAGEDFKYYFALWREYRCAKRPEIFYINRQGEHSSGPRGATGRDWSVSVTDQWRDELRGSRIYVDLRDAAGATEARMRLTNPTDIIQSEHASGRFFEAGSLEKLRRLLKSDNPNIVEVGANIGNHVVWYGKHLNPARIYPVEPNPEALAILEDNIQVNGIDGYIDRRGMGYGAGRGNGRFRTQTENADNLGATFLVQDDEGGIETRSLDELMGDAPVDFIKIDAEGMEFDVLEGAAGVIERNRPVIWVEVKRENMLGFAQTWCKQAGYRIVDSTPYINTIDYFAVPKE